jgi:membrane protein
MIENPSLNNEPSNRIAVTFRGFAMLFYQTFNEMTKDYGRVHAAALAFYILLSIFPLALLGAIIITNILGPVALNQEFFDMLANLIGRQYAAMLTNLISNSYETASTSVWTWIGILSLIYAASYMFNQARMSINALWHLVPKEGMIHSIMAMFKTYALAYLITLIVGISFLVLLFISPFLNAAIESLSVRFHFELNGLLTVIQYLVSPVMFSLIFYVAFRFLPQASARRRDLLPGALITAILYWLGNIFYSIYLSFSNMDSFYGAAGNLILFFFWVYYSAFIFLYGAKFTCLYVTKFGMGLTPDQNTMFR